MQINESITSEITPDGEVLTLTVKLNHPGEVSKSGKSMVHASTQGNIKIPDTDLVIGLNIYSKKV